jgi:chaperone modulatory protein CbpM
MKTDNKISLSDDEVLSLLELCRAVDRPAEHIVEMVEYEIVQPDKGGTPQTWQFSPYTVKRTRVATRLQRDLNINLEGLALALDLLDEVQQLRRQVRFLEQNFSSAMKSQDY